MSADIAPIDSTPIRLLVVEDDIPLAWLIKNLMEDTIFEPTLVFSVEQAEDLLKLQPFDLILLDISLPGEDGLTFYRRKKDVLPPTLLMSAVNRSVIYSGEIPRHIFSPNHLLPMNC